MFAMLIALFGAMLFTWSIATHEPQEMSFRTNVAGDVVATNYWSYQSSVSSYMYQYPATTGTVVDASLAFQTGYIRNPAWTNIVQAGILYTYSNTTLPANAVKRIADLGGNSMMVGVATSDGTMTSLSGAATGFMLPAVIPIGAIVTIGH
ncbi:type IV pilus biogenesis protein PilM [Glaciimonas sp. GG7]